MSFTVYRSSAGSGKTFTLVKEYVKIILVEPGAFRQILAITFTNKAANEMKERVLRALGELSKGDLSADLVVKDTLMPLLIKDTRLTSDEIRLNAGMALEMILHNYSDFAIGTIDSFSHRLIRTFAHDFGLPVNFNVELDADELLSTAVDLLLDKAGDDETLTSILVKFLETRMEEDKGWNIDSILISFAGILVDEEGQTGISRLKDISLEQFQVIAEYIYEKLRQFEKKVREISTEAAEQLLEGEFTSADFFQGERGIWKYFMNLADGKMDKLEPNSYVVTTMEEDKWFSGKASGTARQEIGTVIPKLLDIYEKLQNEIAIHKPDYDLRRLLAKTIYPLAVLNEIEKVLNEFKRQNNLVHISEFNLKIAGIVMNEPVPFIYERLGEKYQHILIDEFQDTSALQWMNFIPLVENSLAGGHFNLIVGDGKQAIYRWRGGDVEQFNALPAIRGSDRNIIFKQREQVLESHFKKVELEHNFRSGSEIVTFNNRFFRTVADRVLTNGKQKIFEGLEQKFNPKKTGGYISLEFLKGVEDEIDYESITLERIRSIISEALEEKFKLCDMAILCRSNRNATVIARYLLEHGLEVVSAESLLISNSPGVRFVIAYLKFLFEPRNDIILAEIRQFIRQSGAASGKKWEQERDEYTMLPVYDLCESLIRNYQLNTVSDPYLQFFLDAVLKFTVRISTGAMEFLDWWEKNKGKLSIIVPEELNAVRVMTIHKAKGLEFPLVILPFAQESRKNTKTYLWVDLEQHVAAGLKTAIVRSDKEMESTVYKDKFVDERQKSMLDLLNLLYVSMTRPEERLYILTKLPPKNQEEVSSLPGFFQLYLKEENYWNEEQLHYIFGIKSDHVGKVAKHAADTIVQQEMISADWRQKIEIRMRAPQMWDIDNPAGKSQWGSRIHTILSWITTAKDISVALEKAALTGLIENGEREDIERILLSVVSEPTLSRFFSDQVKVKTEAEILLPEGLFYRPDRIVFDNDRVTILDYKSGKPNAKHGEQLIRYAGYIEDMGYVDVKRVLVYLEPDLRVVEV
ncbi:MAG: UvrD-helicase domain-containing protein [Bacteroidales bacterium]|nr:UvrD-helicase domain-containing protein [Bacteroidales bacterium]